MRFLPVVETASFLLLAGAGVLWARVVLTVSEARSGWVRTQRAAAYA